MTENENREAVQKILYGDVHADADGNYMSIQNLKDIHDMSGQLMRSVMPGVPMEDWVEDKISTARQILSDVQRFYSKGKSQRHR